MYVPTQSLPKYRHYMPKNLAVVRIDGHDFYLGKYGSEESREKYRRLLAEWLTNHRHPKPATATVQAEAGLTIDQLILSYWDRYVTTYYIKDGRPTSEQDNIRQALRFIRRLYGQMAAREFSPSKLKATRQAMIDAGRCRNLINKDVNRVRGMFRWAVEHEFVPVEVYQALLAVAGLRKHRSEARERPPVGPVTDELVEAVLPHVTPAVATMIRVQRLTAMRPQEVILMRAADIDRTDPGGWVYTPERHKSEHHGRRRTVFLGPKSVALLAPYIEAAGDGYLFSPRRSVEQWRAEQRAGRQSPLTPSQAARRPKSDSKRTHGELYDDGAYRKAIRKVCQKLGIPIWYPLQLRHAAACEIRRRFDLETSQAVLGHAEMQVTEIYAQKDLDRARRAMQQIG
jgi:integrase